MWYKIRTMLLELLTQAGLSSTEAEVYEALLLLGQGNPAQISAYVDTSRENTYKILEQLDRRGLVARVADARKVEYVAENPEKIITILENKQADLEQTRELLDRAVQDFKTQLITQQHKPIVQYLHGTEGMKEAYLQSIDSSDSLQYEIMHRRWDKQFKKWLDSVFIPERLQRRIFKRIIVANNEQGKELISRNKYEMRETVEINTDKFPMGSHILVNKDKVIFVSDPDGSSGTSDSVVIQQKTIAKAVVALIEGIWNKKVK